MPFSELTRSVWKLHTVRHEIAIVTTQQRVPDVNDRHLRPAGWFGIIPLLSQKKARGGSTALHP